jgi:signal transduction histidine kinase
MSGYYIFVSSHGSLSENYPPHKVPTKGSKRQPVDYKLVSFAGIVLLACLFYPFVYAIWYLSPGFTFNARWVVIDITLCEDDPSLCTETDLPIQISDQIVKIGELDYQTNEDNRNRAPFAGVRAGETVTIELFRNGEQLSVEWVMPAQNLAKQIESLIIPLLVYIPFWLAGTVILIFMQPHSTQWRLLVLFNYLTAIWLAVGVTPAWPVLYSSLILHAVSWLMLPVFIHLHLVVPSPLLKSDYRIPLVILYVFALLMAALELLQMLPRFIFIISILMATLGSIVLLSFRTYSKRTSSADRVASRLMLAGVALAFGPGIIIWLLPTLLEIRTPGILATSLALLVIPMLPLFYTYAIYKRRLGLFEVRINRLLSLYALFIVYLLILSAAALYGSVIPSSGGQVYAFYIMIILAFALAVIPLQEQFRKRFNKLAYGTEFDPNDLFNVYASKIPAALDRDSLVDLLANEIMPSLSIRRSALLINRVSEYRTFYEHGVDLVEEGIPAKELDELISNAAIYLPSEAKDDVNGEETTGWVRLALLLQRPSGIVGIWLFGARDPDDFYSQADIGLLNSLAKLVAITLENMRLIETVQSELVERKRAEKSLKSYADRLELIHEIDQAVLETNSANEIANYALPRLGDLIPSVRGSVSFYDLKSGEVVLLAVYGRAEEELGSELRLPIDLFEMRKDLDKGMVWVLEDITQKSDGSSFVKKLHAEGIRSVLSAPLIASGELIGSLNLGSDKPSGFDIEHQVIALEVASSLAVAIHSALLLEQVTGHSDELKRLSARLINIQEEERKQISYELHDEIGQVLTAITYNLATVRRDLPPDVLMQIENRLSDTDDLVRQVMGRVRSMSLQLRPSMLKDLGLVPTLRWFINQYGNRLNAEVEFKTDQIEIEFPDVIQTTLYRFVQEGLTNIARHAHAQNVRILLETDNGLVKAVVEDDGIGFNPEGVFSRHDSDSGIGLIGIRERVASIGGNVDITSAHGQGTRLSVEIPLDNVDGQD